MAPMAQRLCEPGCGILITNEKQGCSAPYAEGLGDPCAMPEVRGRDVSIPVVIRARRSRMGDPNVVESTRIVEPTYVDCCAGSHRHNHH